MDIMVFAMICIAMVRVTGLMVLYDYYLRLHARIFLWIASGWFFYALSPVFGLLALLQKNAVYDFLYLALALEGMLLLVSGAIWLFRIYRLRWVVVGGVILLILMIGLYISGGRSALAILVPALQLLTLSVVSLIAFAGRKTFVLVGGNSIYWLLAIFIAGAMQAAVFIFMPPEQLSALIYAITVMMSVLIIIFFMHLEHNILLKRQLESESLYRLIVENQSDLIIKLDMDGRFLYANPKYCELMGVSQDALLGSVIQRAPSDIPGIDEIARKSRLALSSEPYHCRVDERLHTVSGWRWIAWSEKTVFNEDFSPRSVVAAGRDITEQKEAEAEIRRLNQELESRVRQRTAQLENLNRDLETFTYSVSHDLKAPLRSIEGFSQILLEDHANQLQGESHRYLETIIHNVRHMRELIDDLLAYSRMERRTLHQQQILISELVQELVDEHRLELEQSQVQLNLELDHCEVLTDRENLRQVLGNLFDNAIKYSSNAKPPRIEVSCKCQGGKVRILIRDNGIGFDMAYKEKIFELFQRLHGPAEYAGTGVGLAIVQKAVERMKGRIDVVSAPGQGAAFTLEL